MKIIVRPKNKYGRKIYKRVCKLLEKEGVKHVLRSKRADLAIIIGGDGILLGHQSKLNCPIFGIKTKGVGYYTTADEHDFERKIKKILKGEEGKNYFIHRFLRLRAWINGRILPLALNEVLISPIYSRRMFNCELEIGKKKSLERNSGILVYTPTGSHAFAGSLGAKILRPHTEKFGVAAIAPYAGKMKKEMLLERGKVIVTCLNKEGEVCIDGREKKVYKIKHGDKVTVKKSKKYAKIIGFKKKFKKPI